MVVNSVCGHGHGHGLFPEILLSDWATAADAVDSMRGLADCFRTVVRSCPARRKFVARNQDGTPENSLVVADTIQGRDCCSRDRNIHYSQMQIVPSCSDRFQKKMEVGADSVLQLDHRN